MKKNEEKWLKWAVELQAIAQTGLYYSQGVFDQERYQRIREISAEMIVSKTELSLNMVKNVFCNENGYQTPKLDTRAAIFQDEKILLVQEKNGKWSLPGGWVDVGLSIKENVIKEVKEEAGLDVSADFLIAVQDRDKHNTPIYAHKICKIFIRCTVIKGTFIENNETICSQYFAADELPELSIEKNNEEQIKLCFQANKSLKWETQFD